MHNTLIHYRVVFDEKFQVFDRCKLIDLEDRRLCSGVGDKILSGNLADLGIAMMEKFHQLTNSWSVIKER